MSRFPSILAALAVAASPAAALASSASTRISLTVPVRCSLDILGGAVASDRLVLQVRRSCNTGHDILVSSRGPDELGGMVLSFNGGRLAYDGQAILPQAERYYDGVDQLVIEAEGSTAQEMLALASSLELSLVAS